MCLKPSAKKLKTWLETSEYIQGSIKRDKHSITRREALRIELAGVRGWIEEALLKGAPIIDLYMLMGVWMEYEKDLRFLYKYPNGLTPSELDATVSLYWAEFWDTANGIIE